MHADAWNWVNESFTTWVTDNERADLDVLEFGSLDINGSIRGIFTPYAKSYLGVDMQTGHGVDVVADASTFDAEGTLYDVIVSAEVFEHTPVWRQIIDNSHRLLKPNGLFIATMAGTGRPPHSAVDGGGLRDWEHYENISEEELQSAMTGFDPCVVNVIKNGDHAIQNDSRCWGIRKSL
jgi:SAM-dependent methyltransferase